MIRGRMHLVIGTMTALTLMAGQVDGAWAQTSGTDAGYEHQDSRLDVSFSGGKLIDYVESIRRSRPKGAANIVVMPNAKELQVPPITLVAVTVEAAVRLLEGAYTLPNGAFSEVDVETYEIAGTTDMVFKVTAQYETLEIRSSVWSLDSVLTDGHSEAELLGAVDVVLSLFSNKAEIKFHPPTRLLIARGTDEQLDLVREVIEQLISSAEQKRDRIRVLRLNIENLMDQQQERQSAMIDEDASLVEEKHTLDMILQQNSRGELAEVEVIEARGELKRAQAQYVRVKGHLNRIKEHLKKAQDALTELTGPSL